MNNGIFESVQFLNEFNFDDWFKKKKKENKIEFHCLNDEDVEMCTNKYKSLLQKHRSNIKKIFDDCIKELPENCRKFKFTFELSNINYDKVTDIDGNHDPSGFFTMELFEINLWDVKSNLRQASDEGDPDLDTLYEFDKKIIDEIQKYCDWNKIGGITNVGDWDEWVYNIYLSADYLKFADI